MDNTHLKRIITLIDMDCFYCQVELKLDPSLAGKPMAVVQYNQWKQGGIIAVNYEARERGVNRFMRGEEAKKVCPELNLVSVPSVRGKADLTRYRNAGVDVATVFTQFSDCVERASVDEAFIDLTSSVEKRIHDGNINLTLDNLPTTFIVGHSELNSNGMENRARGTAEWIAQLQSYMDPRNPDYRLAVGAIIVEEIRREVLKKTGYHCSAGIGHNKILAKLVAGLHKPRCQTIIPHDNVPELYESVDVKKVRNLGGKFGKAVSETLNISLMSQLYDFSKDELSQKFNPKNGLWLYNIARGIDHDPVVSRLIAESIGCSKNFPGPTVITTKEKLQHWLRDMTTEVVERLEKDQLENSRRAKLLTITFRQAGVTSSRSCPLSSYKLETISRDAFEVLMRMNQAPAESTACQPPIEYLGISTSKFASVKSTITNFLKEKPIASGVKINQEDTFGEPSDDLAFIDNTTEQGCSVDMEESKRSSIKSYFTKLPSSPNKNKQSNDQDNILEVRSGIKNKGENNNSIKQTDALSPLRKEDKKGTTIQSYFAKMAASQKNKTVIDEKEDVICKTIPVGIRIEMEQETNLENSSNAAQEAASSEKDTHPDLSREVETSLPRNVAGFSGMNSRTGVSEPPSFFARMISRKEENFRNSEDAAVNAVLPESSSASSEATPEEDWLQTCPDCNKKIHLAEYIEHLDYHEAVKIHKELNGKIQVKTAAPKQISAKLSPAKKKRKVSERLIDQKPITNFFGVLPK